MDAILAWFLLLLVASCCVMAWDAWRHARHNRRRGIFLRAICLKCGYDLRASKDRCPECGTAFSLMKLSAYSDERSALHRFGIPFVAAFAALLLMANLVAPTYSSGPPANAKFLATKAELAGLESALSQFQHDTGRYPTEEEGLDALLIAPAGLAGWKSPFLPRMPTNPWGHSYVYHEAGRKDGTEFKLLSAGPDGREGTSDDIADR